MLELQLTGNRPSGDCGKSVDKMLMQVAVTYGRPAGAAMLAE